MIAANKDDSPEPEFHTSPDGQLALSITVNSDGETKIGFHGFDWATYSDQLAEESGLEPSEATRQFVNNVLSDLAIIAVLIVDGDMTDAWITELPETDLEYCQEGEVVLFRFWSGKEVTVTKR